MLARATCLPGVWGGKRAWKKAGGCSAPPAPLLQATWVFGVTSGFKVEGLGSNEMRLGSGREWGPWRFRVQLRL